MPVDVGVLKLRVFGNREAMVCTSPGSQSGAMGEAERKVPSGLSGPIFKTARNPLRLASENDDAAVRHFVDPTSLALTSPRPSDQNYWTLVYLPLTALRHHMIGTAIGRPEFES